MSGADEITGETTRPGVVVPTPPQSVTVQTKHVMMVLGLLAGGGGVAAGGSMMLNYLGAASKDDLEQLEQRVDDHMRLGGHREMDRRVTRVERELEGLDDELDTFGENLLLICQAVDVECRR